MELYGQDYYDHYCGPYPYDRSHDWFPAFFRGIARHVVTRLKPGSVLDVGCAKGFLVEALRDQGVPAFGVDLSAYAISQVRGDMRRWCRVASATEPLDRHYDLITCIEVAEHLTSPDVRLALDNICRHADLVLFSSTPEDHYESTHIQVRPRRYWISCFEARGFTLDQGFDASFVAPWAMLFRRTGRPRFSLAHYALGSPASACNLIRVTGPLSHLARTGLAEMRPGCLPTNTGWSVSLDPLRDADLVLLQRDFPRCPQAEAVVAEARRLSLPVLYELDDLLFAVPPEHPYASQQRQLATACIEAIRKADAVTVPSARLRAEVLPWNANTLLLPNYLDDSVWRLAAPRAATDVVTVGYAATPTHLPDIDAIRDPLLAVARRYGPRVRFRFLGCHPAWARGLPLAEPPLPLHEDYCRDYPPALLRSGIDVGLAPLLASRFNLAKSHIKYLEYAAAGIAGVYADLPPYRDTVRDGHTGLLAPGEPKRWFEAICALVEDERLRSDLVRNAQADLRLHWLLSDHAHLWHQTFDSVVSGRGKPIEVALHPPSDPPQVSIVIPVHGQWSYTARCLERLERHTGPVPTEIIVVDNGSEDETAASLRRLAGRVRVIANAANDGFAKACNRGARVARGTFIVFLNNDVEAEPDWLRPLVAIAESDPAVGAVGGKLLFPDGTIQHAGVELRYAAPHPICPAHIAFRQRDGGAPAPTDVSAVTGACMLVRAADFAAMGGFDERYENGYEDVDLCLKLREAGRRIVYTPESVLVHHGGATPGRFLKERENLDLLHRSWLGRLTRFDRDDYTLAEPAAAAAARAGVSIVVVTYNSLSTIAPCLERLRLNSGPQDEVIVVDNASRDATANYLQWFEARYPGRVRVVLGDQNLGFARGVNLGLRAASREYVCLLNPDVMVTPGWLDRLTAHLAAAPDIGAVGPLSDFVAGRQRIDLYLEPDAHADADRTASLLGERHPGRSVETKLLVGFCLLLRRMDLAAAGGLDPDLFLGHDDLDLSLRLRRRGLRLLVAVDAFVHHVGHASFAEDPSKGKYLVQESANALYEKLYRAHGGRVPSGEELWDIGWFQPTEGLVSIVCPVHDQLDLTRRCVASVYEHTGRDFELILVDNGSRQDVAAYAAQLRSDHGNVACVRNAGNEGFAYACNQGLALAKGEFVVLLNNDVVVTPHWLGRLLALLSLHETVGLAGPRTNYSAGPQVVEGASYPGVGDLQAFADRWFVEHAGRFTSVARVIGFCMAMRRRVIERIGGFDTAFGIGNFEDDDFCLRALLAGFRIAVADDVFVHHEGSATFRSAGVDYKGLLADNWEIFRCKWVLGRQLPQPAGVAGAGVFDEEWDRIPYRYEEVFRPALAPLGGSPPTPTVRLLCIPDWADDRWRPAIAAYLRAFGRADPVRLVVRVDPPLPELADRARAEVADLLAALGVSGEGAAEIHFETSQIPPQRRGSLYASATALLPCEGRRAALYAREARACGLPILEPESAEALRRQLQAEG